MTDFLTVFVSCQNTNNSCLFSILLQRILTLYSRTYPIKTILLPEDFVVRMRITHGEEIELQFRFEYHKVQAMISNLYCHALLLALVESLRTMHFNLQ